MTIARHLTIHGRVQGVFYRDWTVKIARDLGLAGWVRNRRDGTVEAVVEGEGDAIDRFIALAEEGPPAADVETIDIAEIAAEGRNAFEKRPTA